MHRRVSRRGFTLIELLVVVAILALLIAILLPSLARARRQAQQVVCQTQMRELSMGIRYYGQAHRGFIPPFRSSGIPAMIDPAPDNRSWAVIVDPYIPTKLRDTSTDKETYLDVHHCPSKQSNDAEGDPGSPVFGSYGMNGYVCTFTSWQANKPNAVFKPVRLDDVRLPTDLILIGESCRMVCVPTLPPTPHAVVPRHRDGTSSNIAWFDGHVSTERDETLEEFKQWWDFEWTPDREYENGLPKP
jgi:prepilin-type N-terminal cleavage/methylation domain-containing protein/prepilin-type processing-associated H-X9-DG protein